MTEVFIDIGSDLSWPGAALSNFAAHSFLFRAVNCASMEGFLQGLKFSDAAEQRAVCALVGINAKRKGKTVNWQATQTLWWQGRPVDRHSVAFQTLLDKAFDAMFSQCLDARHALRATGTQMLGHSCGKHDPRRTVLTIHEFISRLLEQRRKRSGL